MFAGWHILPPRDDPALDLGQLRAGRHARRRRREEPLLGQPGCRMQLSLEALAVAHVHADPCYQAYAGHKDHCVVGRGLKNFRATEADPG